MNNITIIACIDNNYGLGYKGDLLYRFPLDLAHFKAVTQWGVVIMGLNTFNSLTMPLRRRRNIVLTTKDIKIEGVEVYHSIEEMKEILSSPEEKFIIGGGKVYEQFVKHADKFVITHVWSSKKKSDVKFPSVDFENMKSKILVDVFDDKEPYSIIEYTPNEETKWVKVWADTWIKD